MAKKDITPEQTYTYDETEIYKYTSSGSKVTIKTYADRWNDKYRTGKWKNTLRRKDSYVNVDESYDHFAEVLEIICARGRYENALDVGVGSAELWVPLEEYFTTEQLSGIDLSQEAITLAKKNYPQANLIQGNARYIDGYFQKPFDLVFSRGVLSGHMGKDYFQEILAALFPLTTSTLVFDYLNTDWSKWTDEKFGAYKKPTTGSYTSKEMSDLISQTPYADWQRSFYGAVERRDPIVVLEKKR